MSIWDLCIEENVVWVVQCTRHISEMYDVDILRHGGDTIEVFIDDFSVVGESLSCV